MPEKFPWLQYPDEGVDEYVPPFAPPQEPLTGEGALVQTLPFHTGEPERAQLPQHRAWFGLTERESFAVTPSQVRLTLHDCEVEICVEFVVFGTTLKLQEDIEAEGTQDPVTILVDQFSVVGSPGQTLDIAEAKVGTKKETKRLTIISVTERCKKFIL